MTDDRAVNGKDDDRPDHGCDDAWSGGAGTIDAERAAQQIRHERSADTEQHRQEDAARLRTGHERLRESTNDESDDESPEQMHARSFLRHCELQ